ncbi:MAG: transglutaminaseTgpA domain-containing protein [Ilumatobacteraceae bacterium]
MTTPPASSGTRRPVGLSRGVAHLVFAVGAVYGLIRLTGAVALVVMLVVGGVLAVGSSLTGWWRLRSVRRLSVDLPRVVTVGDVVTIRLLAPRPDGPVHVRLLALDDELATGWLRGGELECTVTFTRRGVLDELSVVCTTAGSAGLLWWRRTVTVPIDETLIVPRPVTPGTRPTTEAEPTTQPDDAVVAARSLDGDIDGIRPWRDGDPHHAVHWPTSFRTGALSVFEHRPGAAVRRWIVRADPLAPDRSVEMGRVRATIDEGRRRNLEVLAAVGQERPTPMADHATVERWTAVNLPDHPGLPAARLPWRQRLGEPDTHLSRSARWCIAAASAIALILLADGLNRPASVRAGVLVGSLLTAALTATRKPHRPLVRTLLRVVAGMIGVAGIALVVIDAGGITDLRVVFTGPLPDLLMLLVVVQGFECTDRRAGRAALGFSAVVAAYGAAQRVDPVLLVWLAGWGVAWLVSMVLVAGPAPRPSRGSSIARRTAVTLVSLVVAATATVLVLGTVTVPDGPTSLGRPSSFDSFRPVAQPGSLASSNGDVAPSAPSSGSPPRTGGLGGYPGFGQSLDTSVRGEMSTAVVMRVRAPEPDFWRGQTFASFDGRSWYADTGTGAAAFGPDVSVAPADGDMLRPVGVDVREFIQTYYLEVDHPNVVYAAYRPTRVLIEAGVWARPDGALRTSVVMTKGAVYTVVSERPLVTDEALRAQGDVAQAITSQWRPEIGRYLEVPSSTTARTKELAAQLASSSPTTYDTVRAMEAWIGQNTQYDLDAPLPADGADAVDDFLFTLQRGFCEQIASALTIMLRTQGVPARLATGYVPGERDGLTGVWTVRARDAHAWVEVWFPGTGWQAFDPTAEVPLAGEAGRTSIGGDIARNLQEFGSLHGRTALAVLVVGLVGACSVWLIARVVRSMIRRRRRGRWGLLLDRWSALAARSGVDTACATPELGRRWAAARPADETLADELAALLDRVAFDPAWTDDDEAFMRAAALLDRLSA